MATTPVPPVISLDDAEGLGKAMGTTVAAAAQNAARKQYDLSLTMKIVETNAPEKGFFNNELTYNGLPYVVVVAIEAELVNLLERLNKLGGAVALGATPSP